MYDSKGDCVWLVVCLLFYAVSAVFKPYNDSATQGAFENNEQYNMSIMEGRCDEIKCK